MKKLKIAVFNYDNSSNPWSNGGASEYNNELFKNLSSYYDITIYTAASKGFEKPKRRNNILYYPLKNGNVYTSSKLRYWWSVFKFIKKINADIIIENWFYPFPLMLQFFSKRPVILICHGTYGKHSINKFGPAGFLVYLIEKLYRQTYKRVISVSPTSLKEFRTSNKVLIPPALNHIFYTYKKKSGKEDYIAMLCRIDIYQKGLDIIRDIAAKIPYKIKIAGGGHRLSKFKKSVKSNNIEFIGPKYGKEKIDFLMNSKFFLMPSRYEGFGISALEAQACGKPVVGFDINDLNFCVQKDKTGLLVKPYDKKELLNAILTLLEDDKLLKKLSKNAIKWAYHFDYVKAAEKLHKFIEKQVDLKL